MKIDIASNRPMFFKAYNYLKTKYPTKLPANSESAAAVFWLKEFNVIMHSDDSGKFNEAEFVDATDASVFILKWS